MIYLDNAGTTAPCESAKKASQAYCETFFNPSSIYLPAIKVAKDIQRARSVILEKLGDSSGGLIFTSGATEANNLALFQASKNKNKTILISAGEHPSVFSTAKNMEASGYKVTYIPLKENGEIDFDFFMDALESHNVGFVSIMFVNNETGAINPIKEIGKAIKNKDKNIIFHVDAVQGFKKLPISVKEFKIDLLTISSHKIHGIKGTGALYHASNLTIKPNVFGGGQEFGRRSGTENVPGIMAFMEAVLEENNIDNSLRQISLEKLKGLDDIKINGNGVGSILSVSAKGVKAEVVVRKMDELGIYISTGSACNSHKADNRVLSSMGVSREYIEGTNRFSFSKYTSKEEVERAFDAYVKIIKELRNV